MQAHRAEPPNGPYLKWSDSHGVQTAQWRSQAGLAPPARVVLANDTLNAAAAWRLASQGTAMLWQSDFQNARQLLQALGRRLEPKGGKPPKDMLEAFNRHRMHQAQRARSMGMLLIPVDSGHVIPLKRAPNVRAACTEVFGEAVYPYVVSLRELQGVVGAHEWRKKGVPIEALGGAHIHPHYGVFSPVRGEYLGLLARAPLPKGDMAFDIGTGTGVIAALLARRGMRQIVATDTDARALACAQDNLDRLGLAQRVSLQPTSLFPAGRASLIVCNPPWLPGKVSAPIEAAIYDPGSQMLRGFLAGLKDHLLPEGEGWLILSDLAERLGLRTREQLLSWMEAAGLSVLGRSDTRPTHSKAFDPSDPLHAARAQEVTSLWRLGLL